MSSSPPGPTWSSSCPAACTRPRRRPRRKGIARRLAALGAERIVAVDAASSFSRPGPRLADGVELLGHLLHAGEVDPPAGLAWREID